jgi:hypothetical protein
MARQQYFVVNHEHQWKIKHNGKHTAAYPTQTAAIKDAVGKAHKDGETRPHALVDGLVRNSRAAAVVPNQGGV